MNDYSEDMDDEGAEKSPEYSSWNWKEKDWASYLAITDIQVKRFGELYHSLINDPDRLDKVAEQMGWMGDNWQSGELETDVTQEGQVASTELPYTTHLHPVYTVTRGIFRSMYDLTLSFARLNSENTLLQMAVSNTLREAEVQALLGLSSQDMGDVALTVCQFKRSLAQLNHAMKLLGRMEDEKMLGAELYGKELKKRIFDLRELWLRVNSEMREEMDRRSKTGE